jgi:hypothetical protein
MTILAVLQSCNIFDNSENEIVFEKCDYKNLHKAVLYLKSGNAVTDNSIHLSIIGCDDKLDDMQSGNIFVADAGHGNVSVDSLTVNFKWQSADTLLVHYDSTLRIFNQQTLMRELVIIYIKK